jgi:hypothetical protein
LRAKVGERSERIVARDPPAKGRYGHGLKQASQEDIGSKALRRRARTPAYHAQPQFDRELIFVGEEGEFRKQTRK